MADAADGRILGIVFGFEDQGPNGRLMYAYDMVHVVAEFARLARLDHDGFSGKSAAQNAKT